jgi:hypothetical protein
MPVFVLTQGQPFDLSPWQPHYIQHQEPQLVIDAIKQVIEAVRNPSTWTTAP